MIELITVIVLMGVLGAIGASRFFDNQVFESRAYADQSLGLIRYAQKLAIAQNREVFVQSTPGGFALCFTTNCAAGSLVPDPAGSNNGSSATRAHCIANAVYVPNWACAGRPANVAVAAAVARPEFANGGYFFFDSMGRPHNNNDAVGAVSTFVAPLTLNFSSGNSIFTIIVEPETGYAHTP
jgi:MSHA pilin protein MshC